MVIGDDHPFFQCYLWQNVVEEFEDTKRVIRIRKSKDRQLSTKHSHKTKDRVTSNTNPTKKPGWTHVLRKGWQFLLH